MAVSGPLRCSGPMWSSSQRIVVSSVSISSRMGVRRPPTGRCDSRPWPTISRPSSAASGSRAPRSWAFRWAGLSAFALRSSTPDLLERLVLVSTVFKRKGWYPEMAAGMAAMGPETAGSLMQSPMYEAYKQIAPRVEDWPVLVGQLVEALKIDYDWSAEIPKLKMPVMLVIGDADGIPPSHTVEFFELLGGGKRDAGWDGSGMTHHRLAILPGLTHYDINVAPALSAAVIPFLDTP